MIKLIKRIHSFIKLNIMLILFIIFLSIFIIMFTINIYNNIEYDRRQSKILIDCTYMEPIKINNESSVNDLNQADILINAINQLKYENRIHRQLQIKCIDIDNMNPHSKSNLSIEELDKMLKNTGLEFQGNAFYDMEQTYNVNALFAMAVAMHESGNGYKTANTHNYFGFRGNDGWMYFSSQYDCIQYFGKLIHNYYSDRETISAIQSKYCPDGSPWTNRVKVHMTELKEKI